MVQTMSYFRTHPTPFLYERKKLTPQPQSQTDCNYNATIVAEWIGRMVSFSPRGIALGLSSFGIVGFALMTGAGATTVVPQKHLA